jgi:flavin-dependent dehydrogenase
MDNNYDVVIVGAGLAGLQCACILAERGIHVLLVDRKKTLDCSVHTTGIFVRRTLEDFEFPSGTLGPPVRHVTLYSPGLRALELESPYDEFRVGRMGPMYVSFLQRFTAAGGFWSPETSFVESSEVGGGSSVVLEKKGTARKVLTRLLVGADGARSRVARDLGLDSNREMIVGVEDVLRNVPLNGPPRFHCFLDPRLAPGYIAWVVNDGEEVHLGVGGYAARFEPLSALSRLYSIAGKHVLDLGTAVRVERRSGLIPVGGVLNRLANQRGILLGDAAGAVSPLTAGGLDPCMRLSSFAAHVAESYLQSDDPQHLTEFSGAAFRSHFQKRLWMRNAIKHITHPGLLELGCALIRIPPMKSMAWNVFFGRGSFPEATTVKQEFRRELGIAEP